MIRAVNFDDIENLRQIRNKWYKLDIFRQSKEITKDEQLKWYEGNLNAGYIINDRAYGKLYSTGEVSFYGFGVWREDDLRELIASSNLPLFGECYQFNPFLYLWLEVGFKVVGYNRHSRYHNGTVWDSLLLRLDR